MFTGDSDELIPPAHMKALSEAAVKSRYKEFYSIFGGTHNDSMEVAGMNAWRDDGWI